MRTRTRKFNLKDDRDAVFDNRFEAHRQVAEVANDAGESKPKSVNFGYLNGSIASLKGPSKVYYVDCVRIGPYLVEIYRS